MTDGLLLPFHTPLGVLYDELKYHDMYLYVGGVVLSRYCAWLVIARVMCVGESLRAVIALQVHLRRQASRPATTG